MLFTELVDEIMQEIEARYPIYLSDQSLRNTPVIKYYFYKTVLDIVEAEPPRDTMLTELVALELRLRMLEIINRYDLTIVTIVI